MSLLLYGSSGDIRLELGNPAEAEYSAEDIRRARTRATNIVNSYVEKRYPSSIPFAATGDVPELLNTVSEDLAVYYAKRSKHPGPLPLQEDIKTEYYDRSLEILKGIADGIIQLPELTGVEGDAIISNKSGYTPTFDEDSELDWEIDPDKLDDISDARDQ